MVFSSLNFLIIFLPCVFILYYCVSNMKIKNGLLVIASLLFYALGEPYYIGLLLLSTFVNYILALKINDYKYNIVFAVVFNLGLLFIFKYLSFFLTMLNSIGIPLPQYELRLPIGISFFTFQILSYVIDVYRQQEKAEKNFLNVLLYISFFPQLIAGPIVKYHDIANQIQYRKHSVEMVSMGLRRFVIGLSKKVILSNSVAVIVDSIYLNNEFNSITAWVAAILYCFQIYYDFSGYSDMAIGLGKMFGFEFLENFDYPLSSTTMKDFWRRWHISLSSWFKEYLYIPLGGNKVNKSRTVINKFIVFFCTGLWHGANYTFVLWGLMNGLLVSLEERVKFLKKMRGHFIGWIYTSILVAVCFVMFRSENVNQALSIYYHMFFAWDFSSLDISYLMSFLNPFMLFIIFLCFIGIYDWKKKINLKKFGIVHYIITILLMLLCIMMLTSNHYNPFIYFRF